MTNKYFPWCSSLKPNHIKSYRIYLHKQMCNYLSLSIPTERLTCWSNDRGVGGVTGIFFWGDTVIFPDFFPGLNSFFLIENFHFGTPKTDFRHFEKWKAEKKSPLLILEFFPTSIFNFPPSLLQFSFFYSPFPPSPFFPCCFFPDRSDEISQSEVSGWHSAPPCPPPVTPLRGVQLLTLTWLAN